MWRNVGVHIFIFPYTYDMMSMISFLLNGWAFQYDEVITNQLSHMATDLLVWSQSNKTDLKPAFHSPETFYFSSCLLISKVQYSETCL